MPKDVKGVMREWKEGKLHSGSKHGPVVKSQKQAIAIALSEQRQGRSGDHGDTKRTNQLTKARRLSR